MAIAIYPNRRTWILGFSCNESRTAKLPRLPIVVPRISPALRESLRQVIARAPANANLDLCRQRRQDLINAKYQDIYTSRALAQVEREIAREEQRREVLSPAAVEAQIDALVLLRGYEAVYALLEPAPAIYAVTCPIAIGAIAMGRYVITIDVTKTNHQAISFKRILANGRLQGWYCHPHVKTWVCWGSFGQAIDTLIRGKQFDQLLVTCLNYLAICHSSRSYWLADWDKGGTYDFTRATVDGILEPAVLPAAVVLPGGY